MKIIKFIVDGLRGRGYLLRVATNQATIQPMKSLKSYAAKKGCTVYRAAQDLRENNPSAMALWLRRGRQIKAGFCSAVRSTWPVGSNGRLVSPLCKL